MVSPANIFKISTHPMLVWVTVSDPHHWGAWPYLGGSDPAFAESNDAHVMFYIQLCHIYKRMYIVHVHIDIHRHAITFGWIRSWIPLFLHLVFHMSSNVYPHFSIFSDSKVVIFWGPPWHIPKAPLLCSLRWTRCLGDGISRPTLMGRYFSWGMIWISLGYEWDIFIQWSMLKIWDRLMLKSRIRRYSWED